MRTFLRAATVLFSAALLPSQHPAPPTPAEAIARATPTGRVFVDSHGDGIVWARGDDWKASFSTAGCTFVPFLGSQAERNFPLTLRLASARCGAVSLPLDLQRAPRAESTQRVVIERGALSEVWELAPRGVEQKFVFAERTGNGEYAVTLRAETELAATLHDDGSTTFANELGGVRVGNATAIDARGTSAPAITTLANGAITWTVPADFVARAVFPLTIDPVVSTFGLVQPPNGLNRLNPDVAYVCTFDGLYAAVVEEVYSATDRDVLIRGFDRDHTLVATNYVDFTTSSWVLPRIASHVAASQFLCVAQRDSDVVGRLVDFAAPQTIPTVVLGAPFVIASPVGPFVTAVTHPEVGGDPSPAATLPGNYCVVWRHGITVVQTIVRTDGFVAAPQVLSTAVFAVASNPTLSRCCGPETGAQQWIVVWEQYLAAGPSSDTEIHGALIDLDGTTAAPDFVIGSTPNGDVHPRVSSKTDFVGGVDRWMVVWERVVPAGPFTSAHNDVYGAIFEGTTDLTGPTDLGALLNRPAAALQQNPCVDTDGTRFAVGFSELPSSFSSDWRPYLSTVHLDLSAQIQVTSYAELLNAHVAADDHLHITAEHSGGTFSSRYMAVWDVTQQSPFFQEAEGSSYRGHLNVPPASFFNHALAGCGPMQLVANGLPALGETMFLDLVGAQGIPLFLIGQSIAPVALCAGCELGIDASTMGLLAQSSIAYTVPPDVTLIGAQVAVQGIDVFAPSGCPDTVLGFEFTLTDEIIVTFL